MKHIKNIARGAAVLAMTMVASMPAMAQDNYVPKNEFSISGFGGLSSLQYKVDGLDHKLGFGGGAGFGVYVQSTFTLSTSILYFLPSHRIASG